MSASASVRIPRLFTALSKSNVSNGIIHHIQENSSFKNDETPILSSKSLQKTSLDDRTRNLCAPYQLPSDSIVTKIDDPILGEIIDISPSCDDEYTTSNAENNEIAMDIDGIGSAMNGITMGGSPNPSDINELSSNNDELYSNVKAFMAELDSYQPLNSIGSVILDEKTLSCNNLTVSPTASRTNSGISLLNPFKNLKTDVPLSTPQRTESSMSLRKRRRSVNNESYERVIKKEPCSVASIKIKSEFSESKLSDAALRSIARAGVRSQKPTAKKRKRRSQKPLTGVELELTKIFTEEDYKLEKNEWAARIKEANLTEAQSVLAKKIRRKALSCVYANRCRQKQTGQQEEDAEAVDMLSVENKRLRLENSNLQDQVAELKKRLSRYSAINNDIRFDL